MADSVDGGVLAMDLFEEIMNEAQAMSDAMQTYTQYGVLTYGSARFVEFKDGAALEVDRERWFGLGERGKAVEIPIRVNVQEFNPSLDFSYERNVRVNGTDWFKHWRQSIIDLFKLEEQVGEDVKGKDRQNEIQALFKAKMTEIAGKYVEVADVPQEPRKNAPPSDRVFRTPEVRRVFNSREECVAAITERFGKPPASEGSAATSTTAEVAPKGFASMAEFSETVKDLRGGGLSNLDIAKELDVPVLAVTKVK